MNRLPEALSRFLHGETNPREFHHADHVRMAFEILRRHSFLEAAQAYSVGLKTLAQRAGRPEAYHETITLAFLSLIAERRESHPDCDFDNFAVANPDLMEKSALNAWYAPARLHSDAARRTFLLPGPR